MAALSIMKLDKYMQNQGEGNFDYDSFKAMHDGDPRIQAIIKNFDKVKIEFKQSEVDDLEGLPGNPGAPGDKVGNMAKNATDVGNKL
tara:strand:+ start:336 stop:596 length:261 start_codon:yes stop_codon:yes gene_type:complete